MVPRHDRHLGLRTAVWRKNKHPDGRFVTLGSPSMAVPNRAVVSGVDSVFSGSTTKIQSNSAKLQLLALLFVAMSCVLEPRIGMVRKSLALGDVFQHPPLLSQATRELAAMIGLSRDASVNLPLKITLWHTL